MAYEIWPAGYWLPGYWLERYWPVGAAGLPGGFTPLTVLAELLDVEVSVELADIDVTAELGE